MSRKSKSIRDAFLDSSKKVPELAVAAVLQRKFEAAGVIEPSAAARSAARHLMSGKAFESFDWDDGQDSTITLDDNDVVEIQKKVDSVMSEFPELARKMIDDLSKAMLEKQRTEWSSYRRLEERQANSFRLNLENRWGDALDSLRILHSISVSEGENFARRLQESRATKGKIRRQVISLLHVRACQVCAEIIVLLENGFADGALARWRTLHEVSIIASVIDEADDDLATRYLEHEVVDGKRALDAYVRVHEILGYKAPSKKDVKASRAAFDRLKEKYGAEFVTPFGWASAYLNSKSPRFSDLEQAAGRADMRSHYKMASYNVHASSKALLSRVGVLEGGPALCAGASNAGLEEAGQNTAFTFARLTYLVTRRGRMLDEAVVHKTIIALRDQAAYSFVKTGNQLQREDREIRSALTAEFGDDAPSFVWG